MQSRDAGAEQAGEDAQSKLAIAADGLKSHEQTLDNASQTMAQLQAKQTSLEQTLKEQTARMERLKAELVVVEQDLEHSSQSQNGTGDAQTDVKFRQAEADVAAAETAVLAAEQAHGDRRAQESAAREGFEVKQSLAQQLHTEIRTLSKVLNVNENDLWPPVIDALTVSAGWEMALGAALGDDLNVPLDDAPRPFIGTGWQIIVMLRNCLAMLSHYQLMFKPHLPCKDDCNIPAL